MGLINFDSVHYGYPHTPEGMEQAYRCAVEEALFEHGHDPYSGTIATTEGVFRSNLVQEPIEEGELDNDLQEALLDSTEKRGPCAAVPVYETMPRRTRERLSPTPVQFRIAHSEFLNGRRSDVVRKAVRKALRDALNSGEISSTPHSGNHVHLGVTARDVSKHELCLERMELVTPRRAKIAATQGKPETRYFVVSSQGLPSWDQGFATQAEARAQMKQRIESSPFGDGRCEIIAVTRRQGGEPLVKGEATWPKMVDVTATVSLSETVAEPMRTGRTGWFFCGWAAC